MNSQKPLISALKSAVIRVSNVAQARHFYEGVLGFQLLSETTLLADKARRLWGLNAREVRCARLAFPGENFGMIDLVEATDQTARPMRERGQSLDHGWFTLNFRTNDIEQAVLACERIGARALKAPQQYEAGGQSIREVMIELLSGERVTLLEVGGTKTNAPLFAEPIATTGALVPSLNKALSFYRDALGLNVAVTLDHQGEPFAGIIGAPRDTRMSMALLTAESWTGKFEFIQLDVPAGFDRGDATPKADGQHLGYWMMSVMTPDMDVLQAACRRSGIVIVRGPATIDRPCYGRVNALILRGPNGELLECLAPAKSTPGLRRN
jgi:catechol 2,3-dioxygenase-like lactoylglutathione lyase family enzyme